MYNLHPPPLRHVLHLDWEFQFFPSTLRHHPLLFLFKKLEIQATLCETTCIDQTVINFNIIH